MGKLIRLAPTLAIALSTSYLPARASAQASQSTSIALSPDSLLHAHSGTIENAGQSTVLSDPVGEPSLRCAIRRDVLKQLQKTISDSAMARLDAIYEAP